MGQEDIFYKPIYCGGDYVASLPPPACGNILAQIDGYKNFQHQELLNLKALRFIFSNNNSPFLDLAKDLFSKITPDFKDSYDGRDFVIKMLQNTAKVERTKFKLFSKFKIFSRFLKPSNQFKFNLSKNDLHALAIFYIIEAGYDAFDPHTGDFCFKKLYSWLKNSKNTSIIQLSQQISAADFRSVKLLNGQLKINRDCIKMSDVLKPQKYSFCNGSLEFILPTENVDKTDCGGFLQVIKRGFGNLILGVKENNSNYHRHLATRQIEPEDAYPILKSVNGKDDWFALKFKIDDRRFITRDAGSPLQRSQIQQNISGHQFADLAKKLDLLHRGGYFHIDIKLDNILAGKTESFTLIDWDTMAHFTHPISEINTAEVPGVLRSKIEACSDDDVGRKKLLTATDQFGFIFAMFQFYYPITTYPLSRPSSEGVLFPSSRSNSAELAITNSEDDHNIDNFIATLSSIDIGIDDNPIIISAINSFVKEYIDPQYHDNIRSLLINPARYTEIYEDARSMPVLSEMIKK